MDNVTSVLRKHFIKEFNARRSQTKHKDRWKDNEESGKCIMRNEHWRSKLNQTQIKLLEEGDTKKWDSTLFFHVLLFSSWCLLARKIQDTKFDIMINANVARAKTNGDLSCLRSKDRIIIDLVDDPFFTEVTDVCRNQFQMLRPFKFPEGYKGHHQSQITVDVYVCKKTWGYVEELRRLRNTSFAHSNKACATVQELNNIVRNVERIYQNLNVSQEVINDMKAIKDGKATIHTVYVYKYNIYNCMHRL